MQILRQEIRVQIEVRSRMGQEVLLRVLQEEGRAENACEKFLTNVAVCSTLGLDCTTGAVQGGRGQWKKQKPRYTNTC